MDRGCYDLILVTCVEIASIWAYSYVEGKHQKNHMHTVTLLSLHTPGSPFKLRSEDTLGSIRSVAEAHRGRGSPIGG